MARWDRRPRPLKYRPPRALVLLGCLVLAGCFEEEWRGFVYPNRNDLTQHREVGAYGSLEECRSAAIAAIDAAGWGGRADYECGLNCKAKLGPSGPLVCERTER